MNAIKTVIAGASVAVQAVGLLGIGFMVFDLATLPDSLVEQGALEEALVSPYIYETVASYAGWLGTGLAAAIVAWLLILKGVYRGAWFLGVSRVLAWCWMPLIPVGTGVGVLVLSARAAAIADAEAQP